MCLDRMSVDSTDTDTTGSSKSTTMTSTEANVAEIENVIELSAGETEDRSGVDTGCCRGRQRSRWFYVEPVLVAFCFIEFPLMIVVQKYSLDWISVHVFNTSSSRSWSPADIPSPCDPNISDSERHQDERVQSLASLFLTVQTVVSGIPALAVTILLGAGSDRFGRRFAVLPPLLGEILVIIVVYSVVATDSSIGLFLIGNFIFGCSGSHPSMTNSCFAYVADKTPADRRMIRITLLQLCVLLGGIMSPFGVGPIVGLIGVENMLLLLVSIAVANFAYAFFFLHNDDRNANREPVTVGDQSGVLGQSYVDDQTGSAINTAPSGQRRLFPRCYGSRDDSEPRSESAVLPSVQRQSQILYDGFRRAVSLFVSPWRSRVRLNILMAAFFIAMLPTFDLQLSNLFMMNEPLCWTVGEIGRFTGTLLAVSALGALVVTPVMKKCVTDWHIAMTATLAAIITEVFKFFVRNTLMMYFCAVFGAIASVEVLCALLGAIIFNTIYSKTLYIASGFVFLVMSAFYAVSLVLLLVYHIRGKLEIRYQQMHDDTASA